MNLHLITEYWEKTRKGDVKAFGRLYKDLFPVLYRYALKITGDNYKSEEIVQDFFVKLWIERKKIIIRGSVKRYCYTSVHNMAINAVLERSSFKNSVNSPASETIWLKLYNMPGITDSFILELEAKETEDQLLKQIEKLPPQCKKIFQLSRHENKTNKEIAVMLNISENTVRTQLYRALEKLSGLK
ncbi:MAG: RNA polymerase sigma-70 factor [Bacteroidales bacterium]|nr:RNA polymerase sigma-70 factor [Bacteroidales bacterium]